MERTVSTDRLFALGNYKNIRFTDTISSIPTKVAFNEEAVAYLRLLQMVTIEMAYRRYVQLNEKMGGMSVEDSLTYLEQVRDSVYDTLKELLNGELTSQIEPTNGGKND